MHVQYINAAPASEITRIVESFAALDKEEARIQKDIAKQRKQQQAKQQLLKDPAKSQFQEAMDRVGTLSCLLSASSPLFCLTRCGHLVVVQKVERARKIRQLAETLLADATKKLQAVYISHIACTS